MQSNSLIMSTDKTRNLHVKNSLNYNKISRLCKYEKTHVPFNVIIHEKRGSIKNEIIFSWNSPLLAIIFSYYNYLLNFNNYQSCLFTKLSISTRTSHFNEPSLPLRENAEYWPDVLKEGKKDGQYKDATNTASFLIYN